MPNFSWLSSQDAPEMGDASLDALPLGAEPAEGLAPGLQPLADALAALRARPGPDELAGEAEALAEFEARVGGPVAAASRSRHRRRPLLALLLSARAAAAAAVVALSLGGFATAAFTGKLPAPAQQFAHRAFGAPPARGTQAAGTHPGVAATPAGPDATGPDATGPAAFGLCNAWAHARAHGTSSQHSVAFRNLAAAAGRASHVAAYCAAVPHPGASSSHTAHPGGPPASRPHGPPTSHPTPHATGKPTSHP
jgi:hypothetical protein